MKQAGWLAFAAIIVIIFGATAIYGEVRQIGWAGEVAGIAVWLVALGLMALVAKWADRELAEWRRNNPDPPR